MGDRIALLDVKKMQKIISWLNQIGYRCSSSQISVTNKDTSVGMICHVTQVVRNESFRLLVLYTKKTKPNQIKSNLFHHIEHLET